MRWSAVVAAWLPEDQGAAGANADTAPVAVVRLRQLHGEAPGVAEPLALAATFREPIPRMAAPSRVTGRFAGFPMADWPDVSPEVTTPAEDGAL